MGRDYLFRQLTPADLPQIERWLAMPHVAQWWGDPREQYALICGDLEEPCMRQLMFSEAGTNIGYLQCYELSDWNSGFGLQPAGTLGIDLFVGDPDKIARGYGSALLQHFAGDLLESGTPRVVSDPDPANRRAIRAYQKAGFTIDRIVDTPDGPALLMVRDR